MSYLQHACGAGKGRRLGKKKLQEVHEIAVDNLLRVNLHLDI